MSIRSTVEIYIKKTYDRYKYNCICRIFFFWTNMHREAGRNYAALSSFLALYDTPIHYIYTHLYIYRCSSLSRVMDLCFTGIYIINFTVLFSLHTHFNIITELRSYSCFFSLHILVWLLQYLLTFRRNFDQLCCVSSKNSLVLYIFLVFKRFVNNISFSLWHMEFENEKKISTVAVCGKVWKRLHSRITESL